MIGGIDLGGRKGERRLYDLRDVQVGVWSYGLDMSERLSFTICLIAFNLPWQTRSLPMVCE